MRDKPLIMIADDNPTLRKMLRLVLTRNGYEVIEAADGVQAVELAGQHRPDLMLLDIRMPEMDGIEALRRIRRLPQLAEAPAMMLTAAVQRPEVVAAIQAGACDYIAKSGFDIKAFLAKVGHVLRREPACPVDATSRAGQPPSSAPAAPAAPFPAGLCQVSAAIGPPAAVAPSGQVPGSAARFGKACTLRDAAGIAELVGHTPPIAAGDLASLVEHVVSIKALPFVLPQVMAMTGSQYSTAEGLVGVIEQDVALAGKVLAVANSSLYRRGRDSVTNLKQAVKNIGFDSVRQAALGLGVMELFHKRQAHQGIDRLACWEHSLASATIARILAARAGMDESQAFVVGLLHNIGRLIYDELFGEPYARMLDLCDSERALPADFERSWMGLDHSQMAEAVMRQWKMPHELREPIGQHRLPLPVLLNKPEPQRRWAGLVQLADQLATCMGLGDSRAEQLSHVDNELSADYGIDDVLLSDVRLDAQAHLRELKMMMLVYMPRKNYTEHKQVTTARPVLYLCLRPPHFDAVGYYLRLRCATMETFTSAAAFALRLAKSTPDTLAVVNLLPSPAVDRGIAPLDPWAEGGAADRVTGLVLARPDQTSLLLGPFGQAFFGLLAPLPVRQMERFLKGC